MITKNSVNLSKIRFFLLLTYLPYSILESKHNVRLLTKGKFSICKAFGGLVLLLFLGSCSVDSSYDLSKDIDLTMALSGDGLAVKLGNTEKMYLRDVLKTDESSLLDTISSGDNRGLYYLAKRGSSSFNVAVKSITPFDVKPVSIETDNLFTAESNISDVNFAEDTIVSVTSNVDVEIHGVPAEVKEIHTVLLSNVYATIKLSTDNSKFKIASYTNLKIKFPGFVKSSSFNNVNEYVVSGASQTITIPIETLDFPVDGSFGQKVVSGEIQQNGTISIDGTIGLSTNGKVSLSEGETVKAIFSVSFSKISPQQITGLVDPTINLNADPLQIRSELPNLLKDDTVHFSASNPTVKLNLNTLNLPLSLLFRGILESRENGQAIASVSIPQLGRVSVPKGSASVLYFSQTGIPFDPSGVDASAQKEIVTNLNNLVKRLPDEIAVDLNDGKVIADQSVEHSIRLGQNYAVGVDYEILIPFQFDKGLQIIYNDSIVDMNKDLKDYQAEGLTITATALNTIPLNIAAQIIPYDVDGKIISEIAVESATIGAGALDAAKETEISVKFSPASPAYVSKIEKLKFKFTASASDLATGEVLLSSQYIQLNNLRIKLNGKIITNFN